MQKVKQAFNQLKPFNPTPGRQCAAFHTIMSSPKENIDKELFTRFLERNINRVRTGLSVEVEREAELDHDNNDSDDELMDLPDLKHYLFTFNRR